MRAMVMFAGIWVVAVTVVSLFPASVGVSSAHAHEKAFNRSSSPLRRVTITIMVVRSMKWG